MVGLNEFCVMLLCAFFCVRTQLKASGKQAVAVRHNHLCDQTLPPDNIILINMTIECGAAPVRKRAEFRLS